MTTGSIGSLTGIEYPMTEETFNARRERARKDRRNRVRRERREALTSLGLKRVKGAMGGVYYE